MSTNNIGRIFILLFLYGALCANYAQGAAERTVSEAINYFQSESHKMISELEQHLGASSEKTETKLEANIKDLRKFIDDLEKFSKSKEFLKSRNDSAKPDGKFAQRFSKLQKSFSSIMEIVKVEPSKIAQQEQPQDKDSLSKQDIQNLSTLEEKMENWIDVQNTSLLIDSITLILVLVALIVLVFFRGKKSANSESIPGIGNDEIRKILSTLANIDHRIKGIGNISSESNSAGLEERINEIDRSLSTMSGGINNIILVLRDLRDGKPPVKVNGQAAEDTKVTIPSSPVGISSSRPSNAPNIAKSSAIRYRVENLPEVQSGVGLDKPIFVKDTLGECWINESTGELTVVESSLAELDDPNAFLSMFFDFRGGNSNRNTLNYIRKARVKKDGSKWILVDKGELN